MKKIYIDYNHLCYRCLFAIKKDILEGNRYNLLRQVILKNIFNLIDKFNPDEVVVAYDHEKNWRKQLFEAYKAHRKAKRDPTIDWEAYYQITSTVFQEIKETFPFLALQVPYLEADDIIGWLVSQDPESTKILVTSDTDYFQLMRYPNTKMYDAKADKVIIKTPAEALRCLEIKILSGDKQSDNIPPLYPRLGPKTAEKMLDSDEFEKNMLKEDFANKYKFNQRLIDLTKIPTQLTDYLSIKYREYPRKNNSGLYQYFINHGLSDMVERVSDIAKKLAPLVKCSNHAQS